MKIITFLTAFFAASMATDVPIEGFFVSSKEYLVVLKDQKTFDKGTVKAKIEELHGSIVEKFDGENESLAGYLLRIGDEGAEEIKKLEGVVAVDPSHDMNPPKTSSEDVDGSKSLSQISENFFTADVEKKDLSAREADREDVKDEGKPDDKKDITVSVIKKSEWQTLGGKLSWGQGYNSHLEKGLRQNVVTRLSKMRRSVDELDDDVSPSTELVGETMSETIKVEPNGTVWINDDFFDNPPQYLVDGEADDEGEAEDEDEMSKSRLVRRAGSTPIQLPESNKAEELDKSCSAWVYTHFYYVSDYHEYLHALDVSAAFTISGWGQKAKVSGNHLDQTKMDSKHITFIAVMKIERKEVLDNGDFNLRNYKKATFAKTHGDQYVKGMRRGGELLIRLNFEARNGVTKEELKADAEASLKFWGIKSTITADAKKKIETLSQKSTVDVAMFQKGNLEKLSESTLISSTSVGSLEAVFQQMKAWADNFRESTCRHNYPIGPITDDYRTLESFPEDIEVPNYSRLVPWTNEILEPLVKARNVKDAVMLKYTQTGSEEFPDEGEEGLRELGLEFQDLVEEAQDWCDKAYTEDNPKDAKKKSRELSKKIFRWSRDLKKNYINEKK